jgi:hypothetical protein
MSWAFNRDNKTFFIAFLRNVSEWTEMIFATGVPLDRLQKTQLRPLNYRAAFKVPVYIKSCTVLQIVGNC